MREGEFVVLGLISFESGLALSLSLPRSRRRIESRGGGGGGVFMET